MIAVVVDSSQADIDMTGKLSAGGKILETGVLGHLIITADRYYSMADEGFMR